MNTCVAITQCRTCHVISPSAENMMNGLAPRLDSMVAAIHWNIDAWSIGQRPGAAISAIYHETPHTRPQLLQDQSSTHVSQIVTTESHPRGQLNTIMALAIVQSTQVG